MTGVLAEDDDSFRAEVRSTSTAASDPAHVVELTCHRRDRLSPDSAFADSPEQLVDPCLPTLRAAPAMEDRLDVIRGYLGQDIGR